MLQVRASFEPGSFFRLKKLKARVDPHARLRAL
jgi:hypothetical protein